MIARASTACGRRTGTFGTSSMVLAVRGGILVLPWPIHVPHQMLSRGMMADPSWWCSPASMHPRVTGLESRGARSNRGKARRIGVSVQVETDSLRTTASLSGQARNRTFAKRSEYDFFQTQIIGAFSSRTVANSSLPPLVIAWDRDDFHTGAWIGLLLLLATLSSREPLPLK